ncbi:hypothetical protein ACFWAY_30265 [Rhodococcus sp. NPDC059968]|uniref:hypothetical protein n=1 Tax=Rhodococcus sp. NPDC059968 TaxID=3347017 RepID=UPI00366E9EFF
MIRAVGVRDAAIGLVLAAAPAGAALRAAVAVRVVSDFGDTAVFGTALPDAATKAKVAGFAAAWGVVRLQRTPFRIVVSARYAAGAVRDGVVHSQAQPPPTMDISRQGRYTVNLQRSSDHLREPRRGNPGNVIHAIALFSNSTSPCDGLRTLRYGVFRPDITVVHRSSVRNRFACRVFRRREPNFCGRVGSAPRLSGPPETVGVRALWE